MYRSITGEILFTFEALLMPGGGKELFSFTGPQFDREITCSASPQSQNQTFGEEVEGIRIEEIHKTPHFILDIECGLRGLNLRRRKQELDLDTASFLRMQR